MFGHIMIKTKLWSDFSSSNGNKPANKTSIVIASICAITAIAIAIRMGNACIKNGGSVGEEVTADGKTKGGGHRLGGSEDSSASATVTPRAAAAAAAEARATQAQKGGISAERRRKDDLVGRLTEIYHRRRQEPPFGLASFPLQRLEQIYAQMKVQTQATNA